MNAPLRWHLLCQVIDNFGDAGVMWRLARQLRDEHGCQVRFFIDQPDILQKLAPDSFSDSVPDDFSGVTGAIDAADAASTAGAASLPDDTPQSGASRQHPPQSPDHDLTRDGFITIHTMEDSPALVEGADVVVCGFQVRLPDRARAFLRQLSSPQQTFPPKDACARDETPAPCRNGPHTPTLIQLEYLSAEDWVEAGHALPSLQPDGLIEYFFNPGFTPRTGGLLRERDLLVRRDAFMADPQNRITWLRRHGVRHEPCELLVSVLCYASAPLTRLLEHWLAGAAMDGDDGPASSPPSIGNRGNAGSRGNGGNGGNGGNSGDSANSGNGENGRNERERRQEERRHAPPAPARLHLLIPGASTQPWLQPLHALAATHPSQLRITPLPFLPQPEFDPLLWSCDLNLVRGEDSWLRALWAGRPWLWQAYPQTEASHLAKLDAFLGRGEQWIGGTTGNTMAGDATSAAPLSRSHTAFLRWQQAMRAWNGAPEHGIHDVLCWLNSHSQATQFPRLPQSSLPSQSSEPPQSPQSPQLFRTLSNAAAHHTPRLSSQLMAFASSRRNIAHQ